MKKLLHLILVTTFLSLSSCQWFEDHKPHEEISKFTQIGNIALTGGETAAEISAFDQKTNRLFVVNAAKASIDVVNMEDPFNLVFESEISIAQYGAVANSVSVNNGLLAAAVEASTKTDPGKVVIWNTVDLTERAVVTVGSLPDMVTFSPDGKYIVCANEGEPNEDYSIDPKGSVSIIRVPGFRVSTLDFSSLSGHAATLRKKGFRTPGPDGTSFEQDVEPEYAAISHDSKTAWVTLQENNAIAKLDLHSAKIEAIFPLGFKDHAIPGNELDPSDRDGAVMLGNWPVKGMYLPDAIAVYKSSLFPYVITANEGDSRLRPTSDDVLAPLDEGDIFNEEERIGNVTLDPTRFPNALELQSNTKLGRLKITNTLGDIDGDGDYDELFSFGTRSFTIRNGFTGQIVYESGSALEKFLLEKAGSLYDDGRSDDKGAEPESVAVGKIGSRVLAFVGLERADALVVVDVTNPYSPLYLQVLHTGDAPEGVLFIPADESPNKKSLIVTSCEGDGTVQVFQLSGGEAEMIP
ncbi:MAG: choice-of-anchor I family protein [Chryseolinea sp.]